MWLIFKENQLKLTNIDKNLFIIHNVINFRLSMIEERTYKPTDLEVLNKQLEAALITQGFRENFNPRIGGTNRVLRYGNVEVVCLPIDLGELRVDIVDEIDPFDPECQDTTVKRDLRLGNRIEVAVYVPVIRLIRPQLYAQFNQLFAKCRSEGVHYLRQRRDILIRKPGDLKIELSRIFFLTEAGGQIWENTPENLRSQPRKQLKKPRKRKRTSRKNRQLVRK